MKRIQVKVFSNSVDVNDFLEDIPPEDVYDIKMTEAFDQAGDNIDLTFMIIYEEEIE